MKQTEAPTSVNVTLPVPLVVWTTCRERNQVSAPVSYQVHK